MAKKAVVIYDTKFGNTEKIAKAVAHGIEEQGVTVACLKVEDVDPDDGLHAALVARLDERLRRVALPHELRIPLQHGRPRGNETVDVTCSYEDHPEHTRFYLVYPNFGDELFVHDPVVGLDGSVVPPNALLPILIVIGAGALACLVIAASIWTRRRNAAPTPPS